MDTEELNEDRFYRNMDDLHGHRVEVETELHALEKTLSTARGTSSTSMASRTWLSRTTLSWGYRKGIHVCLEFSTFSPDPACG